MARETRSQARVACEGPSPTMKGRRFFRERLPGVHRDQEVSPTGGVETGRALLPAILHFLPFMKASRLYRSAQRMSALQKGAFESINTGEKPNGYVSFVT